ncbi:MAG: hypothetical protein ACT4ON_10690 [Bacteroidota bacterium]
MSEGNSNPLFELIKSLSGPEKRYFKLFASRHIIGEANVYVSLFDIIDKQKTFDENKIFSENKKIRKAQFHNTKKYLYDIILKSLNSFHINDSNDTRLKQMIHQVKILYEKALYAQAKKIIRKAKNIAILHELYTVHIDLIHWERAIYNNFSELKKIEGYLAILSGEEKEIIEKIKLINELKSVQDSIFSISILGKGSKQTNKMQKQWEELEKIMHKKNTDELTFTMSLFLYNASVLYYRTQGDKEKNFFYNKKLVELFDNNPERYAQSVERYLSVLHNFIIACEEFDKSHIPEILNRLKKLNDTSQVKQSVLLQAKIFQMSAMIRMELLVKKGEFKQGIALIDKEINAELEKYEKVIPVVYKWHLYYCIALVYFGEGKFNETHSWLNKLLNDPAADLKQDVATSARILNLMTHIELGNTDYLQYIFKSTSRFLSNKMELSKVEGYVLDHFKKIIHPTSSVNSKQFFIKLRKQLLPLQKNINEKSIFTFIDIISWLESKIEKKPFAEIVKEKAKK